MHFFVPRIPVSLALLAGIFTADMSYAQLEEIIVTARRQVENLQTTPVAVSALSASILEEAGISTITDVKQVVPSLQITTSGGKVPTVYIRGVGQRADRADLDPGVGQYLNGIFIPRTDSALLDAVDVASIQVLRGPQGTLFGKNSTGGAMLISTVRPDPLDSEATLSGKLGQYGRQDLKLSLNSPLLDNRGAVRISLLSKQYDGYLKNPNTGDRYGDENRLAATVRLLFDINDNLSSDLFAFWTKQDENSAALTCRFQSDNNVLMGSAVLPGQNQFVSIAERCKTAEQLASSYKVLNNPEESSIQMESTMLALTLNGQIGELDVESISAWSHQYSIERYEDQDGVDMNIISQSGPLLFDRMRASGISVPDEDRHQYSQEFKLTGSSDDAQFDYTMGVFGAYETLKNNPRARGIGPEGMFGLDAAALVGVLSGFAINAPANSGIVPLVLPQNLVSDLTNISVAAFSQINWNAREWLQLTAGLRYTTEDKTRSTLVYQTDYSRYAELLNARLRERGSAANTSHLDGGIYSPIAANDFHLLGPKPPTLVLEPAPIAAKSQKRFSQVTPAFTATFLATDALLESFALNSGMMYFTASKGFKAGGLDLRGTDIQPFEAELVNNLEVGLKVDAADSRIRANAALYRMDYNDIQVTVAEAAGLTPINYLTNAGQALIQGAELELTLALERWQFHFAAGYTDADYLDYTVGTTEGDEDRSNEPFPLVPKTTASLSMQYRIPTSAGTLTPRLFYYWRDEIYTGQDGDGSLFDSTTIAAQGVLGFRLNYLSPSENLRLTAYVDNVTNAFYYGGGFGISGSYGAVLHAVAPPRHYGVEFQYRF
ncbi:MAG: iron complex outermembrane receptor protein [Bermanella sp.]|jgi:iron complex outermembrane receptor protein